MSAGFSLGVGDSLGFDGGVSAAKLAMAGDLAEPQYQGAGGALSILELRIHGVGGGSPEELLEQPDCVQVGGDNLAQFLRRFGPRRRLVRWPLEGYWWGGLTSNPSTRALWVLLIPLLLSNLAAWAAPAPGHDPPKGARVGYCLAAAMRWAGYVLTLMVTASVATASLDVFGWQCATAQLAGSGTSCRPRWVDWVPAEAGPRLVIYALVPLLVLALLGYVCQRTLNSYERWTVLADAAPEDKSWPLALPGFWHGQRPVRRQQLLHLAGGCGMISLYLAYVPASHPFWRYTAIVVALAAIGLPAVLLACPQARRTGDNPYAGQAAGTDVPQLKFDRACLSILLASLAVLLALITARVWWQPTSPASASTPGLLPGDAGIWEGLSIAMAVLILAVAGLTLLALLAGSRGTPAAFRPFACGFLGPVALGLACVLGGVYAAGLNLLLPQFLIPTSFRVGPGFSGNPSAKYPIELPWPLFAFMAGFLVMLAALLFIAVCIGLPWFFIVKGDFAQQSLLSRWYSDASMGSPDQRRRIGDSLALAKAIDHTGLVLATLSVAGIAGTVAFYWLGQYPWVGTWVPRTGQWAVGVTAGLLWLLTRQAITNRGKRKMIGVLWDVGTFWPRACQPFAPPCYMERSVPELVNRLHSLLASAGERRAENAATARTAATLLEKTLGVKAGDPPPEELAELSAKWGELGPSYQHVLINGYSQGTFIAAAVIAQLPADQRAKVLFMTAGCPLRRLFGRGFPAYFGYDSLTRLRTGLAEGPSVRWRNAVRASDYIGGFVFSDPFSGEATPDLVDRPVLDPPCVVPADAHSLPTIHGHLDFWPDPQVAVLTQSLIETAKGACAPVPSAE